LADIGVEDQIFVFAYNRLIKPFVEAKALLVNEMANDEEWRRGYCPICGAWPMIGYLTGEGGQRLLVCSFCSHEYGFSRVECPFCQNSDQESLEYIFMDGRNHERLEICNSCRRYIKIIDFRERTGPFFPEIWHIATLNLDLTAQTRSLQHCADNYTIPG
jgi:FdhE protein